MQFEATSKNKNILKHTNKKMHISRNLPFIILADKKIILTPRPLTKKEPITPVLV